MSMSINDVMDSPNVDNSGRMQNHRNLNELSEDDFMRLFLKQVMVQDPLKPFSSSDMMQQMSQFTSLKSAKELEKTINQMSVNMGRTQLLSASQLIGKKVVIPSVVAQLTEKEGMDGSVVLTEPVSDVTIEIKDKGGNVIKTVKLDKSDQGVVDFHWDGLNEEGNQVEPGFYDITAKATVNGESVDVITAASFKVNSVALDHANGNAILNLDGIGGIDVTNIIKLL